LCAENKERDRDAVGKEKDVLQEEKCILESELSSILGQNLNPIIRSNILGRME
jgi:hypothetical protein